MALDYKTSLGRYRRYLQVVQTQPLWGASLWLILTLILVTIMILVALRPTLVTIAGLLGQIRQEKELIEKMTVKISALQNAEAEHNQLADQFPLLDEAIPPAPRWSDWSGSLAQIASESGVSITSFQIKDVVVAGEQLAKSTQPPGQSAGNLPEGISPMNYTVVIKGEFTNEQEFLRRFENTRRINQVSQVSMQKNQEGILLMTIKGYLGFMSN